VVEGAHHQLTGERAPRAAMRGPWACVAADHPLAANAGMRVLDAGGSAADAAIAMAAVMVVVQPQYSNLGGDLFALVFDATSGKVAALNASGPAPMATDPEVYRRLGEVPLDGPLAVTVPGCVDGWWQLHQRAGRLPWRGLFEAAIGYAEGGFPASRLLSFFVDLGRPRVFPADYFKRTFGHVEGDGGQVVLQPAVARSLEAIAEGGAAAFYQGEIARHCIESLNARGGCFTVEEWRGPGRWLDALSVPFAGYRVHTQPPQSQGFVLLRALKLFEDSGRAGSGAAVRAAEHAFREARAEAGDPDHCAFDARELILRPATAARREPVAAGARSDGDTTYMLAIDREGNAVSLIQSIFNGWGSGVVAPEAGVIFNNRMCGFTLRPGHPNELAAGKRPMHTLHSYIATLDGPEPLPLAAKTGVERAPSVLRMVGGTPGAHRQPQTNLQVLDAILGRGEEPQFALDAPRWSLAEPGATGGIVDIERRWPDDLGNELRAAGITTQDQAPWWTTGRAYVATIDHRGIAAAADPRGEGLALVM